jgi:hypothetical protein
MDLIVEDIVALGPSAPTALVALHEFVDGLSMTQLGSLLGLTHSGTVRLVDGLIAAGVVSWSWKLFPSPRVVNEHLTVSSATFNSDSPSRSLNSPGAAPISEDL